ncbi:MAG: hypothetical protein LBO64_00540 [Desulfovibrio sp.]|jgi:hypothetical protein|nr:hypothetical protein [Desulfovibrio sp.]
MHFSIVKINPKGANPSHGFDDVILPLYHALRRLNFDVELLFNRVNIKSRNIVFGSCIAPRRASRVLPGGSIIFNLEQLQAGSDWRNTDYMAHLRDFAVWDYSLANTRELAAAGITDVTHVPPGYVPEMTRLGQNCPQDVGVLFYGRVSDRRNDIVRRLLAKGAHVLVPEMAFGNLRDALLARARMVLNVHQFIPAQLEVVRLGYVWANKKPVLSERGADSEIPEHLREACAFVSYDDIPEAATALLADAPRLAGLAQAGFEAFASRPLAQTLEKIVGKRVFGGKRPTPPDKPVGKEWLVTRETAGGSASAEYAAI